jgi:hypothetical protein
MRKFALYLFLLPTPALAEVCDKVRPLWTPETEPTVWGEMIALMGTPPSLILILLSALALRFRHEWGALIVVVLWTAWASIVVFVGADDDIQLMALQEGCIGSPSLFIAAVAAISVAMIVYVAPPFGRGQNTEKD